jgi:hypothetical protein
MVEDDKKQKKTGDGVINSHIINSPTHINVDGSIAGINNGYGSMDLTLGATTFKKDYLGSGVFTSPTIDISTHEAIYAGTQPFTLATQAGILGASAIGENLLEMKINTIGDARNFMVGVNNVASVFSENSGLLKSIESASALALNHGRLATEAIDRLNIPAMTNGIGLATAYHLDGRQMIELSESVTTVLAYGQAVQTKFDNIISSVSFKNGIASLRDASATLEQVSPCIPTYIASEAITSPFIYAPQRVKIKEVEKALPEVKKDLPIKTTEAIELMEYVYDKSTKNDDRLITIAISEVKRAVKNIMASSTMFIQQTTQKVEITSMPKLELSTTLEKSPSETIECYIRKNSNGDYLFENNNVYIKNKDANYAVIFDAVYSLKEQGGKIEYKKIIELCKKRKVKITKKSILRALTGKDANLFKYVKGIKQEPKYGISLFVAMQDGKEIEFNNKK